MSIDAPAASPNQHRELIDSQRTALLGALATTIAHEFNNLMTPVMTLAEEALNHLDDLAAVRKALETTLKQTEKAVKTSRQLLDLVSDHPDRTEICALRQIVDEAITACVRPFSKDGIELQMSIDPDLRVRARPQLLEQVLVNLLFNARQAMHSGGGHLKIEAQAENGAIELEVSDSRPNVSAGWLKEHVTPFLSTEISQRPEWTDEMSRSLLACRAIADIHGATIEAETAEPRGCTFRLRWPRG